MIRYMARPLLLAATLFTSVCCLAQAEQQKLLVEISGAVLAPGTYAFAQGARLHDASRTGQVSSDAWNLGAALLRGSAVEPQLRLKGGILFDLRVNRVHAKADDNPALHSIIDRLESTIETMPVTGRVVAQLNPLQQLIPANNGLLETGDRIIYPRRPAHVRITGAVQQDCTLDHAPAQQPSYYLRQCARLPLADASYVYVIQPDGTQAVNGIAHWNAEPANVAVGAVLYVPINPTQLSAETPYLNQELAEFLATQYKFGGRFGE